MTDVFDPQVQFADFYTNPYIASLGHHPRWTISGHIGELDTTERKHRKAPIDVQHLAAHGRVRGAYEISETCLMTRDELTTTFPLARNNAFYLRAHHDRFVVLDIEKTCPPAITSALLALPHARYREVSMSGMGYHCLFPLPTNFHDHPAASVKPVLRHTHGWYEILIDHWVTFTRQPIPSDRVFEPPAHDAHFATIETVYSDLACHAQRSTTGSSRELGITLHPPDIPHIDTLINTVMNFVDGRLKTPADFDNDMSRYEFSVLAIVYRYTKNAVRSPLYVDLDAEKIAWIVYLTARELLEFRPKHDELRNGVPYLLDRAGALIAGDHATTTT